MKHITDVDLLGVRLALNVFIATTVLWTLIRSHGELNVVWAVSSMIAASEPKVEEALKFFQGRLVNALIGCVTGLIILFIGGTSEWKIPIALALAVLISTYGIRMPVMWRQAPITAMIVVAGGIVEVSKMNGAQQGLLRVFDVLLGCVVGLVVTFVMSKIWPLGHSYTRQPNPVTHT